METIADETRCVCQHAIEAHRKGRFPGCLLCNCPGFKSPTFTLSEAPVTLSKYSMSAIELLGKKSALQGVGPDAVEAFVKDGKGRVYPAKSLIVSRGDLSYAFHVVLSGDLFIEKERVKGRQLGPGDVAGDLRAFTGAPRWASIATLTVASTLEVDANHLRGTFVQYPDLFRSVVRLVMPFSEHPEEIMRSPVWLAQRHQPEGGPTRPSSKPSPADEKAAAIAARWQEMKHEQEALDAARRAQRAAHDSMKSRTKGR